MIYRRWSLHLRNGQFPESIAVWSLVNWQNIVWLSMSIPMDASRRIRVHWQNYRLFCRSLSPSLQQRVSYWWRRFSHEFVALARSHRSRPFETISVTTKKRCHSIIVQIWTSIDSDELSCTPTNTLCTTQRKWSTAQIWITTQTGQLPISGASLVSWILSSCRSTHWIIWCANWNNNSFDSSANWIVLAQRKRMMQSPWMTSPPSGYPHDFWEIELPGN